MEDISNRTGEQIEPASPAVQLCPVHVMPWRMQPIDANGACPAGTIPHRCGRSERVICLMVTMQLYKPDLAAAIFDSIVEGLVLWAFWARHAMMLVSDCPPARPRGDQLLDTPQGHFQQIISLCILYISRSPVSSRARHVWTSIPLCRGGPSRRPGWSDSRTSGAFGAIPVCIL